jgi:hypothetical protein
MISVEQRFTDIKECLSANAGKLAAIVGEVNEVILRDSKTLGFGFNDNGRYTAELAYRNHNEIKDMPFTNS